MAAANINKKMLCQKKNEIFLLEIYRAHLLQHLLEISARWKMKSECNYVFIYVNDMCRWHRSILSIIVCRQTTKKWNRFLNETKSRSEHINKFGKHCHSNWWRVNSFIYGRRRWCETFHSNNVKLWFIFQSLKNVSLSFFLFSPEFWVVHEHNTNRTN